MATHTEIPVKVNAWVDEGIAPLVTALNEFEQIWTLSSCENEATADLTPYPAYVVFSHQGNAAESAMFAAMLTEALGSAMPYCVQTDWRAENDEPLLIISCPPDRISDLAAAVRKAAGPSGGTARRGLRS